MFANGFSKNIYQKVLFIVFLLTVSNIDAMTNHITKIEVLGKKPNQIYDFMLGLKFHFYKK